VLVSGDPSKASQRSRGIRGTALEPSAPASGDTSSGRLPSSPEAPRLARDALEQALTGYLTPESLYDAKLMVTELVTNSLRHAGLGREDYLRLSVHVDTSASVARIEIADPGPGFFPDRYTSSLTSPGGRGLEIVRSLSLRWGVERQRWNAVWFEIPLRARNSQNVHSR
jgi:two-component sensor histidine kinase